MMVAKLTMTERMKERILNSKLVGEYYKAQQFVDIAWAEFSWFTDSLVEMMAMLYILEKIGIIIEGSYVVLGLVLAFVGCYLLGKLFKAIGTYDRSIYVVTELDPVGKAQYEAALLIIKHFKEKK